jgi:hypothetical protein
MDEEATAIEKELALVYSNARTAEVTDSALRAAVNLVSTQYSTSYVKIPIDALAIFNNRGYPHINLDTYELGWYIDKDTYNQVMSAGVINPISTIGL